MLHAGAGINSIQIQQALSRRPLGEDPPGEMVQNNGYLPGLSGDELASFQDEHHCSVRMHTRTQAHRDMFRPSFVDQTSFKTSL